MLARLSVFPRGVTLALLGVVVDAGGEVAGLLVQAKPRLVMLLNTLKSRGLVFQYTRTNGTVTWTAHPFLRDSFRKLLGCPAERVFDAVATSLGAGLEKRPDQKPTTADALDRYEQLIEATRLAGREDEAVELFWSGLGGLSHLGKALGEYERGFRVVSAFSPSGRTEDLAPSLELSIRSVLANSLGMFACRLGRLAESQTIHRLDHDWKRAIAKPKRTSIGLQNACDVELLLGQLAEARQLATAALDEAEAAKDDENRSDSLSYRATAAHLLGDIAEATADFSAATEIEGKPLYSLGGLQHARHHIDRGNLAVARSLVDGGLAKARQNDWNHEIPRWRALLARIELAAGGDPTPHLEEVRNWTARTGDMALVIEAHLLTARHLLAQGDAQAAAGEAETGLVHAVACGYGLLRIELLVALARIRLAWPDPPRAVQAAREALDLATHPDCQYAWGEADAAQAWGEAYFATSELPLARRAFVQALEVRRRIGHPGVADTERWLARTPETR